jgi:hypothetical protein
MNMPPVQPTRRFPHPLDKKKHMPHTAHMGKVSVFFSAAFCVCAVLVSCEQVSLADFLNDHTIPAAFRSIEVVGNESGQGGGIGFFTADMPVPLSPPGKTVLKITLDNPRRTAYTLEFLGGDAELFVVPGECYFDGPSVIYVTLKYPEGSVTKGVLDITLRLKPREPGYVRPEVIPLPLECAVRQVPFSYAGMYASPNTVKKIILCFDADIDGLSTGNITFEGGTATPVPGSLARIAPGVYEFDAAGITGAPPDVEVNPPEGYAVIPQSREVVAGQDGPVRFLGAAPDNASGWTTGLYLYFDKDIDGLSADDITVDGPATVVSGPLQKNVFGMEGIYRAALDAAGIGAAAVTVTVAVNRNGVAVDPPSREAEVSLVPVTFGGVAADGETGTSTTTALTLTFDKSIPGLAADDITLGAGVTGAKKGALSGEGPSYTLGISGVAAEGKVTVAVNKKGYFISPVTQEARVHLLSSVKTKFGVTATGKDGVAAAFNALHECIQDGGLADGRIRLGDYIDLDGGLTVAAYSGGGGGGFTAAANTALNPSSPPFDGYEGKTLRLIVVGINSFNGKNGNNTPHAVLHFQNIPVSRRISANAYEGSEMQKYLVPVEGNDASGNFLKGLIEAGVPDEILWAPARVLAKGTNGAGSVTVSDKLWLPTEWEMLGRKLFAANGETSGNQVWLAYYTNDGHRVKYNSAGSAVVYCLSSPSGSNAGQFTGISESGGGSATSLSSAKARGIAPAFCVK